MKYMLSLVPRKPQRLLQLNLQSSLSSPTLEYSSLLTTLSPAQHSCHQSPYIARFSLSLISFVPLFFLMVCDQLRAAWHPICYVFCIL